jgi:PHD-finger
MSAAQPPAAAGLQDACSMCEQPGTSESLVQCHGCSNLFHTNCVGLPALHDGDWWCEKCRGSLGCVACGNEKSPFFLEVLGVTSTVVTCSRCQFQAHPECCGFLPTTRVAPGFTCIKCEHAIKAGSTSAAASHAAAAEGKAGSSSGPTGVRRSTRPPKSRLVDVGGHAVLASNMYDLQGGEPSVFSTEFDQNDPNKAHALIEEAGPIGAQALLPLLQSAMSRVSHK